MANVGIETDIGALRPKIGRWLIFIALLGAAIFLAARVISPRQQPAATTTSEEAVAAHCAEFIALAQTKYGPDWKFRLDPRDTICATQTQQEWERQSRQRPVKIEPLAPPSAMISSAPTLPPTTEAAPMAAGRARNPETYCLNVISLAKTKFGPDWRNQIAPGEAADCAAEIQKVPGR